MRLSRGLVLLVATALLPAVVAIGAAITWQVEHEEESIERSLSRTASAVVNAVEREMAPIVTSLQALAASEALIQGDMARFYAEAARVQRTQQSWSGVLLLDPRGEAIFNTRLPLGTPLPSLAERAHVRQVIETGLPAISPRIIRGRLSGTTSLPAAVPVFVQDRLAYILIATYDMANIGAVFDGLDVAASATLSVVDRDGVIIARHNRQAEFAGTSLSSEAVADWQRQPTGPRRVRNVEGVDSLLIVARSPLTGWSVVSGIPFEDYRAPLRHHLLLFGGGGGLAILAGCLGAFAVARRISGDIGAVAVSADSLGRGVAAPIARRSPFVEVRALDGMLARASELIERRAKERDKAVEELAQQARYQQAMAMIGQLAFEEIGLEELLQRAAETAGQAFGADICEIARSAPQGAGLMLCAGFGSDRQPGDLMVDPDFCQTAAAVMRTGLPTVGFEVESDGTLASWLPRERGAASGLMVAIGTRQSPFGILGMYSRSERALRSGDIQFCQSIAYLLSTIIARHASTENMRRMAEQNAQFTAAINAMTSGVVITDSRLPDNPIISVNPAFTAITGYEAEEILGRNCRVLQGPETDAEDVQAIHDAIAVGHPISRTLRNYRKDGTPFWNEVQISPIPNANGAPRFLVGIQTDVTERRNIDMQLLQSQKVEAIGQLSGGIAHDFNNLLTVIIGNAEMLGHRLRDDEIARAQADLIREAGTRGANLTNRLLSFARQQTLKPIAVDLNRLVLDLQGLLRSTLGEHIAIGLDLAATDGIVTADPGLLETVLLNFTINARDAMPAGGSLTISTEAVAVDPNHADRHPGVRPGTYLMTTVADTGTGMPAEIVAKAFDPFFTTKDVGKGTGLGLSMAYGFAKQSGGHVRIDSEIGVGTQVRLYLPCDPGRNAGAIAAGPGDSECSDAKGETILVVEDDPLVATHAINLLQSFGYKTVAVHDGPAALDALVANDRIDLLFTDIVLPGGVMGTDLAREAARLWPHLRILLTSGYQPSAEPGQDDATISFPLLHKPYRSADLAKATRHALNG